MEYYFSYANVLIFLIVGAAFVVLNVSILSRFLRPKVDDPIKETTYECGEPPVGSGWVRFDMRFYTFALIFLIFDVEVAFLYPWALVFKSLKSVPFILVEVLVFIGILIVGLVYVWVKGDLDWIKSTDSQPSPQAQQRVS
jgi:NADH-quinone oxidoreductase subunit A